MENINENNEQENNPQDAEVDASFETDETDETVVNDPPPPFVPPAIDGFAEDRFVRDPNATLGGVLSGVAHRFGFDVALTRLAFVAFTLLTGGGTIILYLLGWLIVPRAKYWPPIVRQRSRSLSGRDIGIALIGLAVLVVLAIGSGDAAAIVVPLGLVAGGVWLLVQNPREQMVVAGAGASMTQRSSFGDAPGSSSEEPWTSPQMPSETPQPVKPRSRGRRFLMLGLVGIVLIIPLAFFGLLIAAIIFGSTEIDFGDSVRATPTTVDEIPALYSADAGEYVLDLTGVDFSNVDEPVEVIVDFDAGRIEVLVEPGVRVDASADVDLLGSVSVFGNTDDGYEPTMSFTNDDPQLILDLDLEFGEIEVTRG